MSRKRGVRAKPPSYKPQTENKVPVTKFDAARRQLETAVRLWFREGDFVSVHQLIMAAHEILRVINQSRGGPPMLGEASAYIREEYTEFYRELSQKSYIFFKHASRDADAVHFFAPETNAYWLLDATEAYHRLTSDIRPLFRLFKWYMRTHSPHLFVGPPPQGDANLQTLTKSEFFSELLPVAEMPEAGGQPVPASTPSRRD